jgi:hypothetical protein
MNIAALLWSILEFKYGNHNLKYLDFFFPPGHKSLLDHTEIGWVKKIRD